MHRDGLTFRIFRAALIAALLSLLGCANTALPHQSVPRAVVNSSPMGLVGLLVMDRAGPPRAAGMKGEMVGYVVSHPALESNLSVRHNGHKLPVLAFRMNIVVVQSGGVGGLEDIRGRGSLDVFYDPAGFNDVVLNDPRSLDGAASIETDTVEFWGSIDFDTYRFYLRIHETAIASRPFKYDGHQWQTPTGRSGWDVMVGEYSDGYFGVAFASNNTMHPLSPEEKLVVLAGPRPQEVRY